MQVDLLPLAFDDSGADLRCRLAFLVLLVGVVKLLQAGRALRSVGILEAAVQAVVAHAVAIAVAGLLMEHVRNLRRQFVGVRLVRILRVRAPEVGLGQKRRQFRPFRRRSGIVGRDAASFFLRRGPLGRHGQGYHEEKGQGQAAVDDLVLKQTADHESPSRAVIVTRG